MEVTVKPHILVSVLLNMKFVPLKIKNKSSTIASLYVTGKSRINLLKFT